MRTLGWRNNTGLNPYPLFQSVILTHPLEEGGCLVYKKAHKTDRTYQIWQEGYQAKIVYLLKTTEKKNSAKISIKNEIKNLHRKNNKNS